MASSFINLLLLFVIFSFSNAHTPTSTKDANIVFDLERDPSTLQYMIKINQGTPRTEVKLVVDFGGELPWFDCNDDSSSIGPFNCSSSLVKKHVSSCDDSSLFNVYIKNPVTRSVDKGLLITDLVNSTVSKTDWECTLIFGSRRWFRFGCPNAGGSFLGGLANTSKGVAGLGRSSSLSLVSQLTVEFGFPRIFAVDLHDTKIYFGGGHYLYGLGERVLTYTPLLINPKSKEEYFVDLRSIRVHGETVPINKELLSINKKTGVGGTRVDIQVPYTTMETSIYKAFIQAYNDAITYGKIIQVTPVAPFTTCYNSSTLTELMNSDPPSIAFVFPKSVWNISLFDMVSVNDGVDCVGFVDGGSKPKTSIVIGAHQIGFLEFDISRSRLGFQEPNLTDE